jgi:hypothetical protein
MLLDLHEEKRIMIACLLWRWWTRRNKINAKDKIESGESVLQQTKYWAGESALYCKTQRTEKNSPVEEQWQKPVGDCLKINVDGAFCAEKKTGGWGFFIRDCTGQVRGSRAGVLQYVSSAAHAEMRACEEAEKAASTGV